MDDNALLLPFERLLERLSTCDQVRAVEAGGGIADLWQAIAQSGFLDALVPEAAGGAGLRLREVADLVEALGRHATPAPIAETMVARALLGAAGAARPEGPIVLAVASGDAAWRVPLAAVANHALVDTGLALKLVALDSASLRPTGSLSADILLDGKGSTIARPHVGLRPLGAVLQATRMAGAAARLLDLTSVYANERVQFGKPIGKQQAIQQQLAVMAEKAVMLRMTAQIGTACDLVPSLNTAAVAKSVASAAAAEIAAIAHAVHGAIGISAEYDLQLYTRRLHEWRAADGSEGYWSRILGKARLADDRPVSTDFIRALYPPA